jgi:maltose-binding protein MalE
MKKFGASAADGQPTPAIPAMGLVWDQWGKAMTALLAGGSDPAAVMKSAAANIRAAIKKSK